MTKFKVGDKVRLKGDCGYTFDSINNVMEVTELDAGIVKCKLLEIEEPTQRKYIGKTFWYMDYEVELIGEPVEMKAREVLELVEKTEEVRIKYKKGDKVRVIKKDSYNGYEYNVGQILTVRSDTYEDAICLDVDQPDSGEEGILFMRSVESYNETEENEEMEFKEGQVYRCVKSDVKGVFTVGELYPVTKTLEGELVIHSDGGTGYTDKFLNTVTIVEFELEGGNKMLEFKAGQLYEYVGDSNGLFDNGQKLTVETYRGNHYVVSKSGSRWFEDEFDERELRLVEGDKSDSTSKLKPVFINVENLMEHIVTNQLEVNEVLSYLGGYLEGSRF